ncbi:MAG: beta-ketoacyl synthase N-terminal-like domain-containing protein [Gemmatimonadota bacterium]
MPTSAEVWITGLGAHTAAGVGAAALRAALTQRTPPASADSILGGQWVARAPDPMVDRATGRLDRSGQFFVVAAREAWQHADLARATLDPDRIAVIEGSSLGPMSDLLAIERERVRDGFPAKVSPRHLVRMMFGAGGAQFAQEIGAHGAVFALSAGSTSGAMAIAEGWAKICSGLAEVVIAGGADAPLDPEIIAAFRTAGILAPPSGDAPCRPFDVSRCGTMLGEGAGVVVLEAAAHARRRGAVPLAILEGTGVSGEDGSMTAPDALGGGIRRATRSALVDTDPRRIGWIKAHGTGTRLNDAAECCGLDGDLVDVPASSLKPLLGHCLGASGAVELIAAVLAMGDGVIPMTLTTTQVDPALGSRRIVLEPEALLRPAALLLSQSLGGRSAALVIGRAA